MEKISRESLYELKNVSQPLVVDDSVFYLETGIATEENTYKSTMYRMDLATGDRTYFGDGGSVNRQMKVSPDRKMLTYLSNNTKNKKIQIFAIPLTGGSASQLTTEKNGVNNYIWVKESRTIYYQTFMNKNEDEEKAEDKKEQPSKKVFTKLKYKMDGTGTLTEDRLFQIKKINIKDLNKEPEAELVLEKDRSLELNYVSKNESYLLYYDQLDPEDEWVYGGTIYQFDLETKKNKKYNK